MRRGFSTALTMLALAAALAACGGSSDRLVPPPTPDEAARATYAGIVDNANALLKGDELGYYSTDDAIERVGTRCLVDVCTTAFSRFGRPSDFSVENVELELLGERRGVSLVVERWSREAPADGVDLSTGGDFYGGWLDHSFFGMQYDLLTGDDWPDRGATVVRTYAVGFSTKENPDGVDGGARWEGLMIGRDLSASSDRGQVLLGNADVTVSFGADAMKADVEFTEIANTESGESRDDMAWRGLAVEGSSFAWRLAADDTISGRFFGPDEEEVGGVFERNGITGTFGGRRTSD